MKVTIKKVLGIALTILLASQGFAQDIKKYSGTVLRMIAEEAAPSQVLKKEIGKFKTLTGIDVVIETAPFDSVIQKITLSLQSGAGAYDVIAAPYQFLGNLVVNKFVQPLGPLMKNKSLAVIKDFKADDIVKGMWDASGRWKEDVYGVPASSAIMLFAYRKDLFENAAEKTAFKAKYGYELVVPKDWKTYRDIAEFFTRKAGSTLAGVKLTQDFYGVSMSGKRHDATTCEWLNYAWSFGGGVFDKKGNLIMNDPKNIAALDYYLGLIKFAPPGVTTKTWDEQMAEMQQGIASMAIIFNDTLPGIENPEASKVVGKMGYGAIPIKEAPAAHYGAWSYLIPAKSKNAEAAWIFLQWFNTPSVQKALALGGVYPNLQSLFTDKELSKIPYWNASLEAYKISSTRPRIPEWNDMNEELMLEISKVLIGETNSKAALDQAQRTFAEILAGKTPVTYQ